MLRQQYHVMRPSFGLTHFLSSSFFYLSLKRNRSSPWFSCRKLSVVVPFKIWWVRTNAFCFSTLFSYGQAALSALYFLVHVMFLIIILFSICTLDVWRKGEASRVDSRATQYACVARSWAGRKEKWATSCVELAEAEETGYKQGTLFVSQWFYRSNGPYVLSVVWKTEPDWIIFVKWWAFW